MSFVLYAALAAIAVGGALFVGTAAALVGYLRTGAFPGDPEPGAGDRRALVVFAALRTAVGAVLLAAGIAGVATG